MKKSTFCRCSLLGVEKSLLFLVNWDVLIWMSVGFCWTRLMFYCDDGVFFVLYSIWCFMLFLDCKPALHLGDKPHLVTACAPFCMSLDSVSLCLVEDLCVCLWRILCLVSGFGVRVRLVEWVGKLLTPPFWRCLPLLRFPGALCIFWIHCDLQRSLMESSFLLLPFVDHAVRSVCI